MKYATIGTIRSLNLTDRTFTLDPISKYRFENDNDESSWKIMFLEDSVVNWNPESLRLESKDSAFRFDEGLESAMVVLKQAKTHIRIVGQLPKKTRASSKNKHVDVSVEVL